MKINAQTILLLIPIIVLQLAIQIAAIIDLARRKRVTGDNKVIWILVIIFGELLGAIVYFAFGRKDDE